MDEQSSVEGDRAYFAQRAAEEQELAEASADREAADAHRRMQRVYLERACIGARDAGQHEEIG